MRKIFQWFVYSSANPQVISLTLKGLIPFLLIFGIEQSDAEALSDTLSQTIINIGLIASGVLTMLGLVRKIILSFK